MKQLCRKFSILLILSFFIGACYSYRAIRISKKVYIDQTRSHGKETVKAPLKNIKNEKAPIRQRGNLTDKLDFRVYRKKYFAVIISFSPVSKINNKGVEFALKGKFIEAEILFKEVITEDAGRCTAYNNLGIIYELFGNKNAAFEMYSTACLMDPDNQQFRHNFLTFLDIR